MSKKIVILTVAILLCTSLTGCTKLISLTDEEAEEIAIYTSSLIAKYNKNQTNGMSYISEIKREEIEAKEATEYQVEEEPVVEEDETEIADGANLPETAEEEMTEGTQEEVIGETISLTELVDISGISVSYQGATAATHYGYEGIFDISPTKGYQYLIMTFQLKNTTSNDVSVDLEGKNLTFKATVEGVTASADKNVILTDEFQSYVGTISAGESQNVVLLFTYPSDGLEDLSNLTLRVQQQGTTYTVIL